jgi:magnesium-protoporphyrin O-methyltransferase
VAKPAVSDTAQHKAKLRAYFDGIGFERWSAIYGQGELRGVRRSVREGHSTMLDYVQQWLDERALPSNAAILDAGCGTGLFSLAMARRGFTITAVDIAPQMVQAASQQAQAAGLDEQIDFITGDLESVGGSYDAVVCLDVLIHYARPGFDQLCTHLANLSRDTLIITYAPHNPALALMHHIGGFFPRSQRRTDIQMIRDSAVRHILTQAGMHVRRSVRVSCGFYHVALLEAGRHPA